MNKTLTQIIDEEWKLNSFINIKVFIKLCVEKWLNQKLLELKHHMPYGDGQEAVDSYIRYYLLEETK